MVRLESSVTAMSGRRPGETWNFARLGRLARASLGVLSMGIGSQGCLVTSSPELQPPQRTAPSIRSVYPAPYLIQELPNLGVSGAYQATIDFDFVSEDLGQGVEGIIYVDFQGFEPRDNLKVLDLILPPLPAGQLNDMRHGTKTFSFRDTPPGCHSATLVLTHSIDQTHYPHAIPFDLNDIDSQTWWYELGAGPLDNTGTELATCASLLVRSADGGTGDASVEGGQQ